MGDPTTTPVSPGTSEIGETSDTEGTSSAIAHKINVVAIPIALATAVMVIQDVDSPIRVWATVLLFVFGPGSGLTQFLRIPDRALQLGVVVALSMTIDILIGHGLLSAHNLSESAAACILAGFTCIRPFRRPSAASKSETSEPAEPAEGEKR